MDGKDAFRYTFYICVAIIMFFLILLVIASGRVAGSNDLPIETQIFDITSLKTGSIIGVNYSHIFGNFISSWFQTAWHHCGIVYKCPVTNEVYILEAANYDTNYRGVFKIPITEWIRFNRKSHIGLARINKEVDPNILLHAFNKRASYMKLDSFNYKWHRLLYKTDYFEDDREKFTCYEIVITVLQDIGVIQKKYACSSYNPSNIMEGELDFCDGYSFDPPVLLDIHYYNTLRETEQNKNKNGKCGCCA